jgi:Fe-S oxidoreductase
MTDQREGGLEAPTRHPIAWREAEFYETEALDGELRRVFDICHGCRRCVSLCDAFPTLFDLVDESPTFEVDGVESRDFAKVVDKCYLCDLCYMTKCPYVPPHEWAVDFPHLMLRAKAVAFRQDQVSSQRKVLTATERVGRIATIPVVVNMVNAANRNTVVRKALDKVLGVHPQAHVPTYKKLPSDEPGTDTDARHRLAVFATCYGKYNEPDIVLALEKVMRHNGCDVERLVTPACCGMPKLEIGDLDSVVAFWEANRSTLLEAVEANRLVTSPVPSCVLMFKQELPLLLPDDEDVRKVATAFVDPFEFLWSLHKEGSLKTDFRQPVGKIFYHQPCHQRVQNFGNRTQDILRLLPHESIHPVARCSGHDGTYGVRSETYDSAASIARPIVRQAREQAPDVITSDCPMAANHIAHVADMPEKSIHPLMLLSHAYGLTGDLT